MGSAPLQELGGTVSHAVPSANLISEGRVPRLGLWASLGARRPSEGLRRVLDQRAPITTGLEGALSIQNDKKKFCDRSVIRLIDQYVKVTRGLPPTRSLHSPYRTAGGTKLKGTTGLSRSAYGKLGGDIIARCHGVA